MPPYIDLLDIAGASQIRTMGVLNIDADIGRNIQKWGNEYEIT